MAEPMAGDRAERRPCWCGKDHWGDLLAVLEAHPPTDEEWAEAEAWAERVAASFEDDDKEEAVG